MKKNLKLQDIFETFVQNVQKGDIYRVKFKDDPTYYTGIPMIPGSYQEDVLTFILKVLEPEKIKGIHEKSITEIEILEKRL
jgi:hypothetical protein